MLTYLTLQENTFVSSNTPEKFHWLDVTAPSEQELQQLHKAYGIPPSFLQAPLDTNEISRFEQDGEYTLLLLRASFERKHNERLPFNTLPIAIIIGPSFVTTICTHPHLVQQLMQPALKSAEARPTFLLALHLLKRISMHFITHLHVMDQQTENIEKTLHKAMQNKELVTMLHLEKSLIYFLTSLRANLTVIEQLSESAADLQLCPKEHAILKAATIENKQAADMADVFSAILSSYGGTIGSVVSNNLNKVMKFLTGITIILMVPTILGSFYGMNVPLPYQEAKEAFTYIMVASIGLAVVIWLYFWRKDWI